MIEPLHAQGKRLTYAHLLTSTDNERWELINGVAYNMSPAPSSRHQRISGGIFAQLFMALEGKTCEVFAAPFDVRLPRKSESGLTATTVLQPDISVVCDPNQIDDHGCVGAPTLVIEILSPYSAARDLNDKLRVYARAGVPEYWVVYPGERAVSVFTLKSSGRYGKAKIFTNNEQIPVGVLDGVVIDLERVFRQPG